MAMHFLSDATKIFFYSSSPSSKEMHIKTFLLYERDFSLSFFLKGRKTRNNILILRGGIYAAAICAPTWSAHQIAILQNRVEKLRTIYNFYENIFQ